MKKITSLEKKEETSLKYSLSYWFFRRICSVLFAIMLLNDIQNSSALVLSGSMTMFISSLIESE